MYRINIGNICINKPVIAAPMAGVTDYPFRQILRKFEGRTVFTEMISSKGLIYGNNKTEELMHFTKDEGEIIGIQIFGSNPEYMKKAACYIEREYKPDILDINMGCPAPKIVNNKSGAALMKDLELAENIMLEVAGALDIPVTVKMRKGWDEDRVTAVELAAIAEKCGIKAVTVHGRTREQYYQGEADWEIIKKVKKKVRIPVIGNGDIFSPVQADEMISKTGCDAVMVARGLKGNPWLIKRINHFLENGEFIKPPDYKQKIDMAGYHLKKAVDYFGEKTAVPRMRKHIAWYIKGLPYSTRIKDKINKIESGEKVRKILKKYKNELNQLRVKEK
ncbi:MAG: tRNA dihydrouridine synthase DusB [Bacillota bacterium]